jgi:hypothetical protein
MHDHAVGTMTMTSADDGGGSDRAVAHGRNQVQWFGSGRTARLREISFASSYVYSPSDFSAASRLLRVSVKTGRVKALVAEAIRGDDQAAQSPSLVRFFPADATLVPVPGSRPSLGMRETTAERLAVALLKHGLGRRIWFGLRRVRAVPKSATAAPGARTSVQAHYDTMAVDEADSPAASHIVLIDDVVTKGRTLLAAALRLQEAVPWVDLRAFALLRTMGYAGDICQFLAPCEGKIEWNGGDARRSP